MITATPIGFLSHDKTSQVKGLVWAYKRTPGATAPTPAPRGIVQIVHGMSEYVGRYDEFARFLVERGFVVCGVDHVGHGRSVSDSSELGCLPAKDGSRILVEDTHELRTMMAARFPRHIPYVMFGHSMGSFVVRSYLTQHGEGLAAAVLSGSGQQPLALSKAGNLLARGLARVKGEAHRSTLLDGMGVGAYAKQIPNARTEFDWLSTDSTVVDRYLEDDLCGTMFSAGGYAALTSLTADIATPALVARIPHDLPILFVSGAQDPVGACGKGVLKAAKLMRSVGLRHVDVKFYERMRHEILNEPQRAQVYTDVSEWIGEQVCRKATL